MAVPAESEFNWKIPADCPIDLPGNEDQLFERNVHLKENLGEVLREDNSFEWHFWLMNKWGKTGIEDTPENKEYLRNFLEELPTDRLSYQSYSRISSFSKVAAFLFPERYSIYDSRVIYTLNWLLFRHTEERMFFFQPKTRNTKLDKYATSALYKLSGRGDDSRPKHSAYHQYCELALDISERVLGRDRPYYFEMLLFAAAPVWVPEDIVNNTEVSITTDYP